MHQKRKICVLYPMFKNGILGLFMAVHVGAWAQLPTGGWRVHVPYNNAKLITQAGDQLYCASESGLFALNRYTEEMEVFAKTTGLSDVGVTAMGYDAARAMLVIGYGNGNIDLKFDAQVVNINALKLKNQTGSKTINTICIIGNSAWVGYGAGILEIDLNQYQIKNSFVIGRQGSTTAVNNLATDGNNLYAATPQGLLWAPLNSPNIADFANWNYPVGLPDAQRPLNLMSVFKNQPVLFRNDTLWHRLTGTWNYTIPVAGFLPRSLTVSENSITVCNSFRAMRIDANLQPNQTEVFAEITSPQYAYTDELGITWLADNKLGLIRYYANYFKKFAPNGPASTSVFSINALPSGMWVSHGGYDQSNAPLFRPQGASRFLDGQWASFNREQYPQLFSYVDWVAAAFDPVRNRTYMACWGKGMVGFEQETVTDTFTPNNSGLQFQTGNPGVTLVGGVAFDSKGNLWCTNYASPNPLVSRTASGDWRSYKLGGSNEVFGMFVDSFDQKWMFLRSGGLMVANATGSSSIVLSTAVGAGGLPSATILSIAQDREGSVWVGTDKGPAIFYNAIGLFSGQPINAQQLKIKQGEFVGYLLGNEMVYAIAIDGANRKWFGTSNGVFLMSADGTQQIQRFTTENSPLLSNTVLSIGIDAKSGEVFFGTDKGVVSYRSDATVGNNDCSAISVFPNPVEPTMEEQVTVSGLLDNGFLKITDIAGNLVFQTKSNGGSFRWNGADHTGRKVMPGVYLFVSLTEQGTTACVAKVLWNR